MELDSEALRNIKKIKSYYDDLLKNLEKEATKSSRAYGGYIRAFKGELVEYIARELVKTAWIDVLKQDYKRMEIDKRKMPVIMTNKYKYLDKIESTEVRNYLIEHKDEQIYKFGTDEQVFIDGELVLPIECKAYTENAMLKRILFDAKLMKELTGCDKYYLLQLESQLGGDYSELKDITYGSKASHALMSQIDVKIHIITLLKGERNIKEPIHNPKFFKKLEIEQLEKTCIEFAKVLKSYMK